MKIIYHPDFIGSYCSDPAASEGRVEAILDVIQDRFDIMKPSPASREDIAACHSDYHIEHIRHLGLYDIAALAAGGAILAAETGLTEPAFGLIRPPGHHASFSSAWGFCFFSNMAIAISKLKREGKIGKAFVLDIDLHFGDGTMNILGSTGYVKILNPTAHDRAGYLREVEGALPEDADIIGISAGFDHHEADWGGLLTTSDYREIGRLVREKSRKAGGGCFAILEGGYNHRVLGHNVLALLEGLDS